jgi:hypothetical protein
VALAAKIRPACRNATARSSETATSSPRDSAS